MGSILVAGEEPARRAQSWYLSVCFWLLLSALVVMPSAALAGNPAGNIEEQRLNAIINDFRGQLGIHQPVSASIVAVNKYLVSAQHSLDPDKAFIIEFERDFLSTLTEEDLRVVIAHELGHIWIFTHFPYLQTEALANEKALQLVSRDSLEKVYQKVWQREGKPGTLQELLAKVE